ncbi:siderophore-interacting protein [Arthrobacter gyeryongensis]|uniref:Siderophore-interacting protein n=1 Tax=Arthrobacter gyeryongensis TaxID=1650592 RepID=A0ABP9SR39_9MICC
MNLTVLRTEQLSPHMVRIIAGGPGFAGYANNDFVDRYVKIVFPQPGVDYELPLDLWAIRETMPREQWPYTRTYTVRWVDEAAQELAIDFVVHGDEGLAGPWALAAQPGDTLVFTGPGGAYNPAPDADWYLFAGDDAALPAIAAAIESLPADAKGFAFLEVDSDADILAIAAPDGVELRWLLRSGVPAGSSSILLDALGDAEWLPGRVDVFAHGERGYMKGLRDIFFKQRGLERSQVSLSGYWAQGRVEDDFQAEKKLPIGQI